MPFSPEDFRDWISVLYAHPEWRDELRRLVLTDALLQLPDLVQKLAEQVNALAEEQRALAEQQRKTVEAVQQLAEQQRAFALEQRRTDERLNALVETVQQLAEQQRWLGIAVGELQTAFGATLEEEAGSVAAVVMRMKGFRVLEEASSLALDGEIDIVLPVEDPAGQRLWVLIEVKARLNQRDVLRWAQRMRSPEWRRKLAEKGCPGPYLVYVYGIRVDLSARQAAEAEGIGLMKGDGEIFPPREPLAAATP